MALTRISLYIARKEMFDMAHPTETAVSSATAVSSTTTEYNYNWCESAMSASETSACDRQPSKQSPEKTPDKEQRHGALCAELHTIYSIENPDYGDSFHQAFSEEGLAAARVMLGNKFRRFVTLSKKRGNWIPGKSVQATLMDLANYALMTILELEDAKDE